MGRRPVTQAGPNIRLSVTDCYSNLAHHRAALRLTPKLLDRLLRESIGTLGSVRTLRTAFPKSKPRTRARTNTSHSGGFGGFIGDHGAVPFTLTGRRNSLPPS